MEVPELSETSGNTNTSVNKSSVQPPKELMVRYYLFALIFGFSFVLGGYCLLYGMATNIFLLCRHCHYANNLKQRLSNLVLEVS